MLEGRLVRLRAIEPGDRARAHIWLNDPEVTYYLTMRHAPSTTDDTWLSDSSPNGYGRDVRLAVEAKDGTHIGAINLHQVNAEDRKAGLGIVIGEKAYWSRGFGRDAVLTLLRFAFHQMNLNRVWLRVLGGHDGAIACYRKCGFREEARLRQDVYRHGRYWDGVLMGILRDEFEALHGAPRNEGSM